MLISDAMRSPGARARIESLAHIEGLDDFDVVTASPQARNAIAAVVREYIALLQRIEDRLDRDACERTEFWLRRRNVPRQLDPALCTEFRVYGDWILEELRTFGAMLAAGTDAAGTGSSAGKLMRGLAIHCADCVAATETRVAEVREGNAHELNREDMLDEGDDIRRGLARWRLPATALITVLIDLGDLKIAGDDETVIWRGLSGTDGDHILGDVVLLKARET